MEVLFAVVVCYIGIRIFVYHANRVAGLVSIRDDLENHRISPEEARLRLKNLP